MEVLTQSVGQHRVNVNTYALEISTLALQRGHEGDTRTNGMEKRRETP